MVADIDYYVKSCEICQRVNKKLEKPPAELHPIPAESPWYRIGVDLVGPLPITESGMLLLCITCKLLVSVVLQVMCTLSRAVTTLPNGLRPLQYLINLQQLWHIFCTY